MKTILDKLMRHSFWNLFRHLSLTFWSNSISNSFMHSSRDTFREDPFRSYKNSFINLFKTVPHLAYLLASSKKETFFIKFLKEFLTSLFYELLLGILGKIFQVLYQRFAQDFLHRFSNELLMDNHRKQFGKKKIHGKVSGRIFSFKEKSIRECVEQFQTYVFQKNL